MAQKKSKAERDLDAAIELHYKRIAAGKAINIMRIPALFAEVKAAHAGGAKLEAAIASAVMRHCLPKGTRVRIAIKDRSKWSGPDNFEGQIGTVEEHDEKYDVPPRPAVLVRFDKPIDLGWANTKSSAQWVEPHELEVVTR